MHVAFVHIRCTSKQVVHKPPRNMQHQPCRHLKRKCVCVDAGLYKGVFVQIVCESLVCMNIKEKNLYANLEETWKNPFAEIPIHNHSIVLLCAICSNQTSLITTIEHRARAVKGAQLFANFHPPSMLTAVHTFMML